MNRHASRQDIVVRTPQGESARSARPESRVGAIPSRGEAARAERVRARAFEIFVGRKGTAGDALSDWLQAEREIASNPEIDLVSRARGEVLLAGDE
ncbi:MAG TPA: DUF2934 domain-containing protein [Phycisphaerales bacterium]|jgi:hypothetical protein|nr:DUF2934 domain-containing protein [Phycisphaerales bacterium]